MKKFNRVLLFLLIMPLCISFSACKKKDGKDNSNQNQIEQPTNPNPDDDSPDYESTKETYSVSFDYNLPAEYDFLLADSDFEVTYKEVGTSTTLARVPDLKLEKYFLGGVEDGSDIILEGSITSETSRNIRLKGKWDETALNKYYYSDGITLDVIDGVASIVSYTGSDKKIFIPRVYTVDQQDYDVREIQTSAFESKEFDKLIVHATNLSIGDNAFKNTSISEFDFSKVNKIGKFAFENTKFVQLNLDDGISSVSEGAFKGCTLLESVDFNNNNLQIDDNLFAGCVKLQTIENARYISRIGEYAFEGCVSLSNTDFIGPSVTVIEEYAFKNCTSLMSLTLPETLFAVYSSAFEGCTSVKELVLGKTFEDPTLDNDTLIKHIGNIGENITKITLVGNSTTKLLKNYFDGLINLETFIMSDCDSLTEIESYAFRECVNLKTIEFSSNLDVDKLTHTAFRGTKFINEMTAPWIYKHQVIYVPEGIDADFKFEEKDAVTKIRDGAFAENKTLQKITIPATVTLIGDGVFEGCTNLAEVVFEENSSITTIGSRLFYNCNKLTTIDLTKLIALTKIDDYAFSGVRISNMVIPSTVTELGKGVFLYASIAGFSISGSSSIFEVQDGILYRVGNGEKILINYPTLKEDELFFCPTDVTEVAAYAFSRAVNLKYVYFENAMEWEEISNSSGEICTKSFEDSATLKLFAEKNAFDTEEVSYVYRWVSLNVTYDAETGNVTLEDGFSTEEKYLYMTVLNQSTHKLDIVYFEIVTSTGENQETIYSIKNGSVKVIATDRDA